MLGRLVSLALAALAAAVLISAQPARADHPANDVTLDLEHGLPLLYPLGLSMFNIYWDKDWDANNPGFARADIDAATKALADSNYFDKTAQYGVPDIKFSGSAQAVDFCGGTPTPTTSSVLLVLFLLCEEATPGTGVPYSFADRIYNVIVPKGTTISDLGSNSCVGYNAYHFSFPSLPGPLGIPPAGRQIIFTVIPAACVSSVAGLMSLIAHEAIEAATDPAPLEFWADFSSVVPVTNITALGTVLKPLKEGEAADICQDRTGTVPVTYGGIAMKVGAYWSNTDNACVVGVSRVVVSTFRATGLSGLAVDVTVNGSTHATPLPAPPLSPLPALPYSVTLLEGATYSFPEVVAGAAGERFTHPPGACSGTIVFPAGNTTADAATTITCAYSREVFVQIATAPAAAATGNLSLTASRWVTAGTYLDVNADATVVAGAGSRYNFQSWSDGSVYYTAPARTFVISSPVTITATYQLQYLVAFGQTGIPAATTWQVTVGGTTAAGPRSLWANSGVSVSFSYESPVAGAAGTRYVLSGTSTSSPLTVNAPVTVTGTYGTQYLVAFGQTGIPAATTWQVTVGGTTAAGPRSLWANSGVSVSFSYESPVAGAAGTRYVLSGTSTSSPLTVLAPVTVTGTYGTQYLVAFDQTGIPAPTAWHVTVAGTPTAGPTSVWVNNGGSVPFSYESPVAGATGTRYVLSGTSSSSPLTVLTPVTVTGTYGTQYLLTVHTSGLGTNTTPVRNGLSLLGTATDATPLAVFLPLGTLLSLNVDDPVNGAGGTEYFFQTFSPALPVTLTNLVTTTASYKTMSQQIDAALVIGGIQQQGGPAVAGSLKQQWAAVTADLALGQYAQALTDIESFVAHLSAQSGKKVTVATARELRLDAANVYLYALCRGVAVGQITPAERAASYAWYSALVTSLGGTPKPNC